MANISDAFGKIEIQKVGKEFLEFIKIAQKDAYYCLVDPGDLDGLEVDENGNLDFSFVSFGRWNYGSNLRGYLNGEWMNDEEQSKAYATFVGALKEKDGKVEIDYTDSETGSWWMGHGGATLEVVDDEVSFSEIFDEEELTLKAYAEANGFTDYEALEYLYGDEVGDHYKEYLEKEGDKALGPIEWFETIYEEE